MMMVRGVMEQGFMFGDAHGVDKWIIIIKVK